VPLKPSAHAQAPFHQQGQTEYTSVRNKLSGDKTRDYETRDYNSTLAECGNKCDLSGEVHTLPPIHVHKEPVITEKEVEYVKPVQVRQKVIHREHPKIVEKPVIVEHHEHSEAPAQVKRLSPQIISEEEFGKEHLSMEREHEKKVFPETKVEKKPIVIDKDVKYVQPVEVEQKVIHRERPKIVEQPVIVQKHEYEKTAPEVVCRENPTVVMDAGAGESVGTHETGVAGRDINVKPESSLTSSSSSSSESAVENKDVNQKQSGWLGLF